MPRRRETTGFGLRIDDSVRRVRLIQVGAANNTPANEYEALMSTAPHEEPELSLEELAPLRDWLQDAIDELPPKLRWVFDAYYVRRLSLRELAREIGRSKTQVARLRDEATAELRRLLAEGKEAA